MSNYYPDDRNIKEIEKLAKCIIAPFYILDNKPILPNSIFDFENIEDGIEWAKKQYPDSFQEEFTMPAFLRKIFTRGKPGPEVKKMKHAEVICTEVLRIIENAEQKLPTYEGGIRYDRHDIENHVFDKIRLAIADFIKNGGKSG